MSTLSVDTIQGKTTAGTVAMPAGAVLQVVQGVTSSASSQSVAAHNLSAVVVSATITPKFASVKFY